MIFKIITSQSRDALELDTVITDRSIKFLHAPGKYEIICGASRSVLVETSESRLKKEGRRGVSIEPERSYQWEEPLRRCLSRLLAGNLGKMHLIKSFIICLDKIKERHGIFYTDCLLLLI